MFAQTFANFSWVKRPTPVTKPLFYYFWRPMRLRLVCKQGGAGSVFERLLVWISNFKWDLCQWFVLLSSHTHKKRRKALWLSGVADPYLHNASRTNKTSSSGIVREAQREASTDMFRVWVFFLKPQEPLKWCRWSRWRDRQRGRGGGGEAAGSSLAAGKLCREIWKS